MIPRGAAAPCGPAARVVLSRLRARVCTATLAALHLRRQTAIVAGKLVDSTDAARSTTRLFACSCGATFPAWRRVSVDLPEEAAVAERLRRQGPFEGHCPSCGRAAVALGAWLEVDAVARRATLVVPDELRGDVLDVLAAHLAWLRAHVERAEPWILQPELSFLGPGEATARRAVLEESETTAHRARRRPPPERAAPTPMHEPGTPIPIGSGVPQAIASDGVAAAVPPRRDIGAFVCGLEIEDGVPVIHIALDDERLPKWRDAKLDARPIHLRNRGYPLLGVRVIAAWMGQQGCIDALVDAGQPAAIEVFRLLSQRFALRLVGSAPAGRCVRDVNALGLESNAALCLESARAALTQGDHPPERFRDACDRLVAEGVEDRLSQTKVTIAPGAYQHVVGALEATRALEHLDRVSRKETLARLLEVEGLPMPEYDAIRRRVLAGALEHGIVAPRRFWRRVVASGLAEDLPDYVTKLSRNRELHEGEEGDLEPEQAQAAWHAILDVCERKDIPPPDPLRRALDLPEGPRPRATPPSAAAGVIDVREPDAHTLVVQLTDARTRLRAATELLQSNRSTPEQLEALFDALERFDGDELLAILPELSDLGPRAVVGLVGKLRSDRRELRQAAAILLGMSLDPDALGPLSDALVVEPTNVWLDVARALGGFGPIALRRLCQLLRREANSPREAVAIERVARSFAEIALSDGVGDHGGARPGHDAVAALADAPDPRVSTAARRALATLRDVSESGAAIRGELPLAEVTEIRGFSRRAYEAIMVPELEVEADV